MKSWHIALIAILIVHMGLYQNIETTLSVDDSERYRVIVVLNYVYVNERNHTLLIGISDFLSTYCFETTHSDQTIVEAILVINTSTLPLQSLDGCLRAPRDAYVELRPGDWVNITLTIESLVDLKLRHEELNRGLRVLTSEDVKVPMDPSRGEGLTSLWNYTHPILRQAIKYVRSRTTVARVNPVVEVLGYVNRNIVYSVTFPSRYPWETLVLGSGDCDDQSNLVTTLLRGLGFNAYVEFGFVPLDRGYKLNIVSNDRRVSYTYVGGFMHSWVSLNFGNLSVRIDPVVAKPYSDPFVLVSKAYFYVRPVLVLRSQLELEDYIMKQYDLLRETSSTGLIINSTLIIYSEVLRAS